MKALVGAFNQEKALLGPSSLTFVWSSSYYTTWMVYSTTRPLSPSSLSVAESSSALLPGTLPSEKEIWPTAAGNRGAWSFTSLTRITTWENICMNVKIFGLCCWTYLVSRHSSVEWWINDVTKRAWQVNLTWFDLSWGSIKVRIGRSKNAFSSGLDGQLGAFLPFSHCK